MKKVIIKAFINMKAFINKIKDKDLINRLQNKFFIKIGLFISSNIEHNSKIRKLDNNYIKKEVDINDEELLKEYSAKHRGQYHYIKNILPRLQQENRFKGFAVIDLINNKIAYLSWIGFEVMNISEKGYSKALASNEAYFLDDHCVRHHQRKGLHNVVFNDRLSYCNKNGIKTVYIVIYLNNIRALQNLKKYNFRLIEKFIFYPLLKCKFKK